MRGERLHPAQALGEGENLERLGETVGGLASALELEGDDGAETAHLALGQFVLRVGGEAGEVYARDRGVGGQVLGDGLGVGGVGAHAHGQGLDAAQGEPAIEGPEDGADGVLVELESRVKIVAIGDHGAAQDVGMAAEILGHAVDDDIGAQGQRLLQDGGGEGVIDDQEGADGLGDGGNGGDIDQFQHRVGGRLDPEHPGAGGHGATKVLGIEAVNVSEFNPARLVDGLEKAEGAAVNLGCRDDVIAGLEGRHRRIAGGHPRAERQAVLALFERGQAGLQRGARGVGRTAVFEGRRDADLLEGVSDGGVDRHDHGSGVGIDGLAGADGAGGKMHGWVSRQMSNVKGPMLYVKCDMLNVIQRRYLSVCI